VSSDDEEWIPEETAKVHDEFLEEIDREEMDRAHVDCLRRKRSDLQDASGNSQACDYYDSGNEYSGYC